jgi:hypothetical protein
VWQASAAQEATGAGGTGRLPIAHGLLDQCAEPRARPSGEAGRVPRADTRAGSRLGPVAEASRLAGHGCPQCGAHLYHVSATPERGGQFQISHNLPGLGRRAIARFAGRTKPVTPRLRSRLLPSPFPGLARWFLPYFDASCRGPTFPPLAEKRTAGSCGLSTKRRVHLSRDAGTPIVPGDGKPPRFRLECRWRACANLTSDPACHHFPSLIQGPPVVGPRASATLAVCRWDQQRTTDTPRHVPALADGSRGRCIEHAASAGQAIALEGMGLLAFLCCHT